MQLFWGKVREGDKRGRQLGYPTANMALHKKIDEGVYVSEVKVHSFKNVIPAQAGIHNRNGSRIKSGMTNNKWLPALAFIGSAKTFGKKDYKAETWILDFMGDLYGKIVTVRLLKKLRGNKKFDNAESLVTQMRGDEKEARTYFTHH